MKTSFLKRKLILLTTISCLFIVCAIGAKLQVLETVTSTLQGEKLSILKNMNEYAIKVDFDPVERILTGSEEIKYVNNGDNEFDALYFHLYPNAFKEEKNVPFEKTEMKDAYPNGFEPGYITIHSIEEGRKPLNHILMKKDQSILKVYLDKPLKHGETVKLNIKFSVKIPPSYGRFGYGEHTVNIANWYPIASVFDENGWNLEPYYAIGDPFYSDVANYRVEVLMPSEYTLAHTGECMKKESIDGKVRWTLDAKKVRDFCIVASDCFKVAQEEVNGVKITSYYFDDETGDLALNTAKEAVEIFSHLYGQYPYKQFSVAASDFFIGGMEYPNLVLIDTALYQQENKEMLEYVIAHETAHQWWYGIVGNDEVDEPWLDESLTEYSTVLYYEKKHGDQKGKQIYKNLIEDYYNAYMSANPKNNPCVCRSIDEFSNSLEYQVLVYYKGAMFLNDLRKQLGEEQFFKVMKVYFDKYKYKNASTEDFINVCEKVSNQSVRKNFKKWLEYEKE